MILCIFYGYKSLILLPDYVMVLLKLYLVTLVHLTFGSFNNAYFTKMTILVSN